MKKNYLVTLKKGLETRKEIVEAGREPKNNPIKVLKSWDFISSEKLPEAITEEISKEFPIVIEIIPGNITWGENLTSFLIKNKLGFRLSGKFECLVKDINAVKTFCEKIVVTYFKVTKLDSKDFINNKIRY